MEISGVASNWAITFLETAERSKSTIATGKSRATPSLNSVLKNNMETKGNTTAKIKVDLELNNSAISLFEIRKDGFILLIKLRIIN